MKSSYYLMFVILLMCGVCSFGAPKPAVVQRGGTWTVDIKYEDPQQIEFRVEGSREVQRFWYLIVTLTNNTDRDVDFYAKSELVTDTFEVLGSGRMTPSIVFKRIKLRHQSKYPFLELLEESGHRLLQGADHTKDIVIIWPDFDAKAKGIRLYVTGLSNETAVIEHPVKKDADGNALKVFLRKTLELSYKVSGDAAFRYDAKLMFEGQRWVMR
ncbi:MAG: hypothetical protein FVQ80_10460 [Planctomycetes bacterium]|nr:hypothetical protein [Planctomycetota bacterium]